MPGIVAPPPSQPSKLRWGDLEDEEDEFDSLPPPVVVGPDDKLARTRLSKRAVERRSWAKFGDAAHTDAGSRLTMVSTADIILERPKALVERQITTLQALCEAETENLLSRLRLLRSYFQNEQLQTPVLQFFRDNLPNVSVKRNEKYKTFELERNNINIILSMNTAAGRDVLASFENPTTNCASAGGLFTVDSAKQNILRAASLQILNFSLDELESQYPGFMNSLHTPGGNCPRLSVGMTPKTRRQPKRGEMLLSVHGSPLGLYQEENLEAIHEIGDGYSDCTN